jgi:CRP-like cAMP-binding protein
MTDKNNDIILKVGDVLFDTDKPLDTAYFLLEGSVDLKVTLGDRHLNLNIGANHFVGDAAVVFTQKDAEHTASYQGVAVAREPVRAVPIPIQDIQREIESCSPLLKAWFASFTSRVLNVIETLSKD